MTMCHFCTTSQRGSIISVFLGSLPTLFGLIASPGPSVPVVILLSLLFPTYALSAAFSIFVAFETGFNGISSGVSFENITAMGPNQVSLLHLLIVLIASTAYQIPLYFYLEKVLPSATANPLGPLFFLKPAYWTAASSTEVGSRPMLASDKYEATEGEPCVRIRGLTKSFVKNGTASGLCGGDAVVFKAVDGLNLDLFEGEIFCLLGHNGAGKSTTISMLTNLISIDEGDATLFGVSVRSQPAEVMRSMGVCLQQNILLDELTVEEHMRLFAGIRGVPSPTLEASVTNLLTSVNLNTQRSQMAKTLSGGQKRRLCTAMAFLGDPKIVFLDEPTTGLDPSARRSLWTFLKQQRAGRVIVLTTHFMDEADLLADRKGIIVDGRLAVCGSSPFLKNKFGLGYKLSLSVNSAPVPRASMESSSASIEQLFDLVRSVVPEASALESSCDIAMSLPIASLPRIPALLDALDSQGKRFGMECYSLNTTTLEQVICSEIETCLEFVMMLGQVFMSFADRRDVANAMDEDAHVAVALDHDAAHRAPLLPSNEFDFQHYKYKSLSLAQHIVVYLRLKASFSFVHAFMCMCCAHDGLVSFGRCNLNDSQLTRTGSALISQQNHRWFYFVSWMWPHHSRFCNTGTHKPIFPL
jgi:ABC-type multidrug transport system ATPase subunit